MELFHDIEVWVGNAINQRKDLCGVYNESATERGKIYIRCTEPVIGSAVTIVKKTVEAEILVVCGVYVIGEELAGGWKKKNLSYSSKSYLVSSRVIINKKGLR